MCTHLHLNSPNNQCLKKHFWCVCIYIYIYMNIHVYVYVCTCVCFCVCTHMRMCVCVCVCGCVCPNSYVQTHELGACGWLRACMRCLESLIFVLYFKIIKTSQIGQNNKMPCICMYMYVCVCIKMCIHPQGVYILARIHVVTPLDTRTCLQCLHSSSKLTIVFSWKLTASWHV